MAQWRKRFGIAGESSLLLIGANGMTARSNPPN